MPLYKGTSKKTISKNISELEHSKSKAGMKRTHKQNIAIAMSEARKSGGHKMPDKHKSMASSRMDKMKRMQERAEKA